MDQPMNDVCYEDAVDKDTSPSLKCILHEKSATSSLAKKLSPSPKLKKSSPSKSISKALRLIRGRAARSLGDNAFLRTDNTPVFLDVNNTVGESEGPISASFHSQLSFVPSVRALSISELSADTITFCFALVPSVRALSIFELSDTITFCFAFEGKVLSKYGTYKIAKGNYARHMCADLIDKDSRHTVTFVVNKLYLSEFVESFVVGDFIRVEGACVKQKVSRDGGTCLWSLYVDATTVVVKSKAFECYVELFLEHRIRDLLSGESASPEIVSTIAFIVVKVENSTKSDGSPSYHLTIVDGPAHADRASVSISSLIVVWGYDETILIVFLECLQQLPFVPSQRVEYHFMVNEVKANGCYSCVAHNINVFKQLSNTLSVVDATILCPLPTSLETTFANHFSKQVSNLGFGKKIFGTLEIVNVNSLDVEYVCEVCKGTNVSRQASNPFCYSCGQKSKISKSQWLEDQGFCLKQHWVWSDDAASQFKARWPFFFVARFSQPTGLEMMHNYIGSGHGKGEHDHVGVVIKRALTHMQF
ncbi:hypothetical protein L7F22_035264 [Adiantum nelumboides]|nr:hypothetical protein [Adiantum nelumboides]